MKSKTNYAADFSEGGIFHVYNRTNNKELLFKSPANRLYFLKQFEKYLHPFLDTFCWSLLPNHFHLLVRVKTKGEIKEYLQTLPAKSLKPIEKKYLENEATTELLLELELFRPIRFSKPYRSYSVNKQNKGIYVLFVATDVRAAVVFLGWTRNRYFTTDFYKEAKFFKGLIDAKVTTLGKGEVQYF